MPYLASDYDKARSDFDGAIGLMLRASDAPTNRTLFERTLDNMVDTINRYDLTGMGAAVDGRSAGLRQSPDRRYFRNDLSGGSPHQGTRWRRR